MELPSNICASKIVPQCQVDLANWRRIFCQSRNLEPSTNYPYTLAAAMSTAEIGLPARRIAITSGYSFREKSYKPQRHFASVLLIIASILFVVFGAANVPTAFAIRMFPGCRCPYMKDPSIVECTVRHMKNRVMLALNVSALASSANVLIQTLTYLCLVMTAFLLPNDYIDIYTENIVPFGAGSFLVLQSGLIVALTHAICNRFEIHTNSIAIRAASFPILVASIVITTLVAVYRSHIFIVNVVLTLIFSCVR